MSKECDTRGCRVRKGTTGLDLVIEPATELHYLGAFCPECKKSILRVVDLLKMSGREGGFWSIQGVSS